jgi:hypothetical protein
MVGSSEPFHVSDFDYLLGLVIVTSTVLPTVSCRCVERVFRCSVFKQVKPLSKHSNVSDKMCACAWCWSIPFISLRTALLPYSLTAHGRGSRPFRTYLLWTLSVLIRGHTSATAAVHSTWEWLTQDDARPPDGCNGFCCPLHHTSARTRGGTSQPRRVCVVHQCRQLRRDAESLPAHRVREAQRGPSRLKGGAPPPAA